MGIINLSRFFFAVSVAAFGFQYFMLDNYMTKRPGADSEITMLFVFIGCLFRISLITLSMGIIVSNKPQVPAISLGLLILGWILFRHLPVLAEHWKEPAEWNFTSMAMAICGGAFVVAGSYKEGLPSYRGKVHLIFVPFLYSIIGVGRIFYGIAMLIFGLQHLLYADFIASMVPSWIPGNYFWAYFTGSALIASGLSILFRKTVRWIPRLLGIMILLWVVLLHLPRIIASPQDVYEWTSIFQAMAISASAFVIAGNINRQASLTSNISSELKYMEVNRTTLKIKKVHSTEHLNLKIRRSLQTEHENKINPP